MLILVDVFLCMFLLCCTHNVQDDRNIYVLVPEEKSSDLGIHISRMLLSGNDYMQLYMYIDCLLVDDIPESSERIPYKLVS